MSLSRIAIAALVAASGCAYAAEDNKLVIQNKIAQCQGCHGIPDWKTAFPEVYRVPKLGGQKPAYLVAAMKAYKSGERDFATMRAMVTTRSDQGMDDITAHNSTQPATVAEKR